jgi:hypothetical protein
MRVGSAGSECGEGKMRYFYIDPLAAAWMAKHFGMRFEVNERVIQEHFDLIDVDLMDENNQLPPTNGDEWLFFVHPDSLDLLVPKSEDTIITYDIEQFAIAAKWGIFRADHPIDWAMEKPPGTRIIERDGKPFMMPESELA